MVVFTEAVEILSNTREWLSFKFRIDYSQPLHKVDFGTIIHLQIWFDFNQ